MPILNAGPAEDLAGDDMPTLNEEDAADDDAPPELSPMPVRTMKVECILQFVNLELDRRKQQP
jgi:hypothetical protein